MQIIDIRVSATGIENNRDVERLRGDKACEEANPSSTKNSARVDQLAGAEKLELDQAWEVHGDPQLGLIELHHNVCEKAAVEAYPIVEEPHR